MISILDFGFTEAEEEYLAQRAKSMLSGVEGDTKLTFLNFANSAGLARDNSGSEKE